MGAITIRKLDDDVVARLKLRAKAAGRSMEEEARQILTDAVPRRLGGQEAVDHFRRLRARINGGVPLPVSSLEVLREIRNEDPFGLSPDDEST